MISNVGGLSRGKDNKEVKSFFEHVALYIGLIVYTAAGAKVSRNSKFLILPCILGNKRQGSGGSLGGSLGGQGLRTSLLV